MDGWMDEMHLTGPFYRMVNNLDHPITSDTIVNVCQDGENKYNSFKVF
jgi:hypothetical protein